MSRFKFNANVRGASYPRPSQSPRVVFALVASVAAACVGEPEPAPALLGAVGESIPPPSDEAGPAAIPVLVEAEAGQLGDGVLVEMDGADAFVTAAESASDEPAGLDDPRVVSLDVSFPEAGEYQMYFRFRIGPEGADDDSFYYNVAADGAPTWILGNSLAGYTTEGQEGYSADAVVGVGGDQTPEVWKWVLLPERRTVEEGSLMQTFHFATREDGFQIDKFAFALVGDGFTTAFTTGQLDAGEPGAVVF